MPEGFEELSGHVLGTSGPSATEEDDGTLSLTEQGETDCAGVTLQISVVVSGQGPDEDGDGEPDPVEPGTASL